MSDELNCSTLLWTQNFLFVLYFISIICLNFQNLQHLQLYECFCYLGLFLTHFLTSCFPPECNASDITCRNGICKPMFWKCDGINDCGDGTDELNCGKSVASVFIQTLKGFFLSGFSSHLCVSSAFLKVSVKPENSPARTKSVFLRRSAATAGTTVATAQTSSTVAEVRIVLLETATASPNAFHPRLCHFCKFQAKKEAPAVEPVQDSRAGWLIKPLSGLLCWTLTQLCCS